MCLAKQGRAPPPRVEVLRAWARRWMITRCDGVYAHVAAQEIDLCCSALRADVAAGLYPEASWYVSDFELRSLIAHVINDARADF